MIALYVLIGLIAVIVTLLLLPVGLRIKYDDKLYCWIKIGFLSIRLYPKDNNSKLSNKENKKPAKKYTVHKNKKLEFEKPTLDVLINTIEYIVRELGKFLKRMRFKRFKISAIVSDIDAAKAAINYGRICGLASNVYALIERKLNKNDSDIFIDLRYNDKSSLDLDIILNTATINLVLFVLKIFFKILPLLDRNSKKGGNKNELNK